MNDALPLCHQKPMYKQTVPCQGYAQSVSTDAGGVKCLLMFIWRKLTCCSLTDPLPLRVSLWSTITGKRCTLAAEVTESRWRSLWTRAAEAHRGLTDPTSGRFVTPLKTLSTGMETCSKSGPRASWNVAVRTCRATVLAAGQRAERQRYWDQIPLLLPPSQVRYFGAASTESNRSRGRLIPKTIGNRKRDCAWGCAWGINTTWENLQIEKHKSVRWAERTPSWFVLFDLQIFSGGVYSPSATSRTISFSISNSFWY